ncbi:MAG: macro domain-containing protein [Myxococcales bacterium]|nr:macro domain-containing protein [Myxococcales bacterium]
MIETTYGDILKCDADALVNTVNCMGVMGRGIALQFKNAYPENFKAYRTACKRGEVVPGRMFVFETGQLVSPRYIINFPTKRHWRDKSRIEDIEAGLAALVEVIRTENIQSVAIPPLGSGLGGLDWADVKPRIESAAARLPDVRVLTFEPQGAPSSDTMVHSRGLLKMTAGRAALLELIQRYLNGLLDPYVTLLEVHKLMYFMQEVGEPLDLKYVKGTYGPYSENLRHVLSRIEGHWILGYADGGDAPGKPLALIPGVIDEATSFLEHHPETRARLNRVAALVEGFESPFGLELLSTVHWVMKHEHVTVPAEVQDRVYAWNKGKQQFTPRQIEIAINRLTENGWVICHTPADFA